MDRNTNFRPASLFDLPSLSARRAWIEIVNTADQEARKRVALRKESVDRNGIVSIVIFCIMGSLSARRAWIEILSAEVIELLILCRSPQGERG